MNGHSAQRAGFTLSELMIVVAIIGTLASIAIPASPMAWRCGYRGVPNGMEPAGENRTEAPSEFLPTSCRN